MSIIQIDISEAMNLKKRIEQIADEIEECNRNALQIARAIDMKVSKRRDIDMNLQRITANFTKQKRFLEQCEYLIAESVNQFMESEKIRSLPDLSVSLNSGKSTDTFIGKHADINDLIIGSGLVSLGGSSNMFSKLKDVLGPIVNLRDPSIVNYIESVWSKTKDAKKTNSFIKDAFDIIEGYGGQVPGEMKDIAKSDIFKVIGYISDIEKVNKIIDERDWESYIDLLGKYGIKEPVKALVMLGGESSAGASLVGDFVVQTIESSAEIATDRAVEFNKILANPESDWKDYVKFAESIFSLPAEVAVDTAWNVVGERAQTMSEILDFTGLTNYGEQFEEVAGKEDATIIDFYETAASEIGELYKKVGLGRTLKYFGEGISETVSEQINDLSDMLADWIDRGPKYDF